MRKAACFTLILSFSMGLTLFGVSVPAFADGATKSDPKCMCRFQGQRYNIGDYACIRSKLARCDMFLNNTTWTFLDDSCGSVRHDELPQSKPAPQFAALGQGN